MESLLGDATKAKNKLGWSPTTSLERLIYEMIENDKISISKKSLLLKSGFKVLNNKE